MKRRLSVNQLWVRKNNLPMWPLCWTMAELLWRSPCTFSWQVLASFPGLPVLVLQFSFSIIHGSFRYWMQTEELKQGGLGMRLDKSLVAGPLWWGRERRAILTDLWPPMMCIVYSAWVYSSVCSHFFTFTLVTSGAFSQSVSKLFWTQSW